MLTAAEIDEWFRVLGYGCLDAPVWYVGIEPGQKKGVDAIKPPDPDLRRTRIGDDEVLWHDYPDVGASGAWRRPLQLTARLYGLPDTGPEVEADAKRRVMLTNIAPLPRHNIGVQIPDVDAAEYARMVIARRLPLLQHLLENLPTLRVLVFHGSTAWRRYRVEGHFGVTSENRVVVPDTKHPMFAANLAGAKRIVLSRTFTDGRHFQDQDRDALAAQLVRWREEDGDWAT